MIIIGVDPGKTGALAFYNVDINRIVYAMNMPTLSVARTKKSMKTEISAPLLYQEVRKAVNTIGHVMIHAFVELVSASPQMGVSSSFTFGEGFGQLKMLFAALQIPVEYVTPAKWKKSFGLGPDKEAARSKASALFPADTKEWTPIRGVFDSDQAGGRAEAALLALYGARTISGLVPSTSRRRERPRL